MDGLSRTGNGKERQTTKKVPAQMFALEKQHLIPVPAFETTVPESIVTYQVCKDNTVLYHSNRHQVPFGTYRPGLRTRLVEQDGKVSILDAQTGEVYSSHSSPAGKGNLVRITNPERRRGLRAGQMQEKALEKLGCREDAADFLNRIRKEKPRYAADQMRTILTILETWEGSGAIETALDYCIRQGLYSAADFGMAVEYFAQTGKPEPETTRQSITAYQRSTRRCILRCAASRNTYRHRRAKRWKQKQRPSEARPLPLASPTTAASWIPCSIRQRSAI